MNPITFESFVEMAEALKADGTPWHFHMIGPKCCFGQSAILYALILENEANGEVFACHFSDHPASQTHQMALLRYGPDFLKKEKTLPSSPASGGILPNADFQKIMEQAKHCCTNGTAWHNHHLPPQCMFNPKPGSHCIVFENEEAGEAFYAYFDHDPTDALAELERLFFAE